MNEEVWIAVLVRLRTARMALFAALAEIPPSEARRHSRVSIVLDDVRDLVSELERDLHLLP